MHEKDWFKRHADDPAPCFNQACPFRDREENRCHLIGCDWVGGTGRQPQPEE